MKYMEWIDFIRGQLLIWGIGIPVIFIGLWWVWTPRRRRRRTPKELTGGDVLRAFLIAQERTRKTCAGGKCGIFVACVKHSRQMDEIDQELERRGD